MLLVNLHYQLCSSLTHPRTYSFLWLHKLLNLFVLSNEYDQYSSLENDGGPDGMHGGSLPGMVFIELVVYVVIISACDLLIVSYASASPSLHTGYYEGCVSFLEVIYNVYGEELPVQVKSFNFKPNTLYFF